MTTLKEHLDEEEKLFIAAALVRNQGWRNKTAAELGMTVVTLRTLMKKHGLSYRSPHWRPEN